MARFEIYINSARGMEKTGSVAESLEEANKMIKSWGGNPNEYANYVIKTPEGKHIDYRDSADVADGKIVGGEGRSMDGIPWGLYQEGGRSYRGFEITSSEGGLRKGVYRFYNWGGGVPFGNPAVDGQFSEAQFQKLIGEGKVKLLDSEPNGNDMDETHARMDDIVKSGSGYTNKGKEGTHGQFATKKAAAKQTAAMYANGYKGDSDDEQEVKFRTGGKVIEVEVESEEREREEHEGDLKDSNLSWYFDVPTRAKVMSMSSDELKDLKSNLAIAKRQIPFSNQAAWNKISSLSEWIKSREEKKDSKMFKVTDKATGKVRLVRAVDSLAAVKKIADLGTRVLDWALQEGKTYTTKDGHKITVKKINASVSEYNGESSLRIDYSFVKADGKSGSSTCSSVDFFNMMYGK